MTQERSYFWYALPVVFSIFGAVVAYLILRKDDPTKAKNCLLIGLFLVSFYIAYYVVFSVILDTFEFT